MNDVIKLSLFLVYTLIVYTFGFFWYWYSFDREIRYLWSGKKK